MYPGSDSEIDRAAVVQLVLPEQEKTSLLSLRSIPFAL